MCVCVCDCRGAGVLGHGSAAVPLTQKKYAGWIDTSDIAAVVLDRSVSARREPGVVHAIASTFADDGSHTAIAAMNFSHHNAFWAVPVTRTMDKVRRGSLAYCYVCRHVFGHLRVLGMYLVCV